MLTLRAHSKPAQTPVVKIPDEPVVTATEDDAAPAESQPQPEDELKPNASVQPEDGRKPNTSVQPEKIPVVQSTDKVPNIDFYMDEYSLPDDDPTAGFSENAGKSAGFWICVVLTSPIALSLAAVILAAFAAVFFCLIAAILVTLVSIIAVVAAGAAVSLVGIVYGVTQLFSFVSAGIFEIGLGITIAGVVVLLSVLLYNFAVRFLPWVIKCTASLMKLTFIKLKALFSHIRKECCKV